MRHEVRAGAAVLLAVAATGAGAALGYALGARTPVGVGAWLSEWSRSAGFGGTAAIVAAAIAYRAARAGARRQQWVDRKVQWWARAQWALERVLSEDDRTQMIGLDVLDALARSEWASEHESDVVDAATDRALGLGTGSGHRAGCPECGGGRGPQARTDSVEEVDDAIQTQEQHPGRGGRAGPGGRAP